MKKLELYRQLHRAYEANKQIMVKDSNLFHDSVEDHFEHHASSNQISNWLSMIKPIIRQSKHQFKTIIRTKPIYDYFKQKRRKRKKSASMKKNTYKNRKLKVIKKNSKNAFNTRDTKTTISKYIRTLTPMEIQPKIQLKYKKDPIQLCISFSFKKKTH